MIQVLLIVVTLSLLSNIFLITIVLKKETALFGTQGTSTTALYREMERKYRKRIDAAPDDIKLNLAIQCINRMPGSKELLNVVFAIFENSIKKAENPLLKRELVTECDRIIQKFTSSCDIDDVGHEREMITALNSWSESILNELEKIEKESLAKIIRELKNKVSLLNGNDENANIIKEIEKLDSSIDKERLSRYPNLIKEYEKASSDLIKIITEKDSGNISKDDKDKQKAYNLRAINAHKKAWDKFNAKSNLLSNNDYKDGKKLDELVEMIGGWDNSFLLPATISYTSLIYNQIFVKLNHQAQLEITKMMIEKPKKRLKNYEIVR